MKPGVGTLIVRVAVAGSSGTGSEPDVPAQVGSHTRII